MRTTIKMASVLLIVTSTSGQVQVVFDDPVSYPHCDLAENVGVGAIAVAFLNDDNHPDVALACFPADVVSVYLGSPDGQLSLPIDYGTAIDPRAVASGDFDGDLDMDLVTGGGSVAGGISVFCNAGSGIFDPPTSINVDQPPWRIKAADLNDDGITDLVVTKGNSPPGMVVLLGIGDGSFGAPGTYQIGGDPQDIALADYDGNGSLDVAVVNHGPDDLSVRFNTGVNGPADAIFGDLTTYSIDGLPLTIAAGDFDDDADVDLVLCAQLSPHLVWVLLNDGQGNFGPPLGYGFGSARRLAVGDLDLDTDLDVAMVTLDGLLVVALNMAGTLVVQAPIDVADALIDVALADLNLDGALDVVVAGSPGSVYVLLNRTCHGDIDGDRVVGVPDLLLLLAQWGPCPPNCLGDLNGDGAVNVPDLLTLLAAWGPCP